MLKEWCQVRVRHISMGVGWYGINMASVEARSRSKTAFHIKGNLCCRPQKHTVYTDLHLHSNQPEISLYLLEFGPSPT